MIENPELKIDVENFAIEMLDGCELFVKIYGMGFAKERLALNFKTLYTEGERENARGQYHIGTSGIMEIFSKGENGNLLTFQDIEKKGELATALHESVHAIFNKTPEECTIMRLKFGSGVFEKYDNDVELGRGLNEGFTNWVCEKAGLNTTSYFALTNLVKSLELAVGPENIMRFGTGNIATRVPELLEMQPNECWEFLGKADSLYDYDHISKDYNSLLTSLEKTNAFEREKIEGKKHSKKEIEDVSTEYKKLKNNQYFQNLTENEDYIKYAQEENLDLESEETMIAYLKKMKELYSNKAKEMETELKAEILQKYFAKELESLIVADSISIEDYKKYNELYNLMHDYGKVENETLKSFFNSFEVLKKRLFKTAKENLSNSIIKGNIRTEEIEAYRDVFVNGNWSDLRDFFGEVSGLMVPEEPDVYTTLIDRLSGQNMISNIFDYKILELQTESGNKTSLYFDNKSSNHFRNYITIPKIIKANQELEDASEIIDITLTDLQSLQEIVNKFLVLKEEINQRNPNTKIQIVENVIITMADGEEPSYHIIEGNEIVPATAREIIPMNNRVKEERLANLQDNLTTSQLQVEDIKIGNNKVEELDNNIYNSLSPITKNPFKKLWYEIQKRFFKSKTEYGTTLANDLDDNLGDANTVFEESAKQFNDRIRIDNVKEHQTNIQSTDGIHHMENTQSGKPKLDEKDEELTQ